MVNTILVRLIQFVCYVRSRRRLISSVSRRDRIAIGKLHSDVCRMHPQKRERAASQSALMSVSSVKVVLLKANLIYRRCFSLLPSLVPFLILREQDDLISFESDAPSKFAQIYLLTFLQNIARLTRRISNDCFILDVNRTSVTTVREILYFAMQALP